MPAHHNALPDNLIPVLSAVGHHPRWHPAQDLSLGRAHPHHGCLTFGNVQETNTMRVAADGYIDIRDGRRVRTPGIHTEVSVDPMPEAEALSFLLSHSFPGH